MTDFEEAACDAITAIDGFLRATSSSPGEVSDQMLRELSFKIERARTARTYAPGPTDPALPSLRHTYRARLVQLQARLSATELRLRERQACLTEDCERLQYVQDWHNVFRTTQ